MTSLLLLFTMFSFYATVRNVATSSQNATDIDAEIANLKMSQIHDEIAEAIGKNSAKDNEIEVSEEVLDNVGRSLSLNDLIKELGLRQAEELEHTHEPIHLEGLQHEYIHEPSPKSQKSAKMSMSHGELSADKLSRSILGILRSKSMEHYSKSSSAVRFIENPKRAGCDPEERTVQLPLKKEHGTSYYPTCIRLPRCGGCCLDKSKECQPISTEEVLVRVVKYKKEKSNSSSSDRSRPRTRSRNTRRRRRHNKVKVSYSYVNVSLVEHTKCDCKCISSESDCDSRVQRFDENRCGCVCKNKDDEKKCQPKVETHNWNQIICKCLCKQRMECSKGEKFDEDTCRCEFERGYTWGDSFSRRSRLLPPPSNE